MPRFAANLSLMFTELPFLERFAAARRAGFAAVEFLFPYEFPAGEIGTRLRSLGLEQALFNLPPGDWAAGERGVACLAGREAEFAAGLETAKAYVEATGARRVHLMAGCAPRDDGAALRRYKDAIRRACDLYAPLGVTIVIEPLNRRQVPVYLLDDYDFAAELIADLGIANLGLQFDIYHCQILHGDITTRMRAMMPIIRHVQVASVPSRNEPMSEELNDAFLFAELDRLGYDGFIGCEYNPKAGTEAGLGWFAPYSSP